MYDIAQLNDMLVPELMDLAEQMNIPNPQSNKENLIGQIMNKQTDGAPDDASASTEKPRRKRFTRTTGGNQGPVSFISPF